MIRRWLRDGIATPALAGFLISGALFALPGALLPAWSYDVPTDYGVAGRYFLCLTAGLVVAAIIRRQLGNRLGTRSLLVSGCAVASAGLIILALLPNRPLWRMPGLAIIGIGAGLLHSGLFAAVAPAWENSPATTLIFGGIFFGGGSVLSALVIAGTYYAYSLSTILLMLAAIPASFIYTYATRTFPQPGPITHPRVVRQFRSGTAILFALLLFFQFGNEWSIAGWLPIYLIHRLGTSPASALKFLAGYFGWLMAGRIAMYYLLPRVAAWKALASSAAASLLGCGMLLGTDNKFGAGFAAALLGLGFASIYPLTAAGIGRRFPYYHPGFFNGIFSIALVGGMLAPWIVGEFAGFTESWGVLTLPVLGTFMVVILLLLIWLERKVSGE